MADQPVEERRATCVAELRRLARRAARAISARPWVICTSRPCELAHELHVVVAGHAERGAGRDHAHHEAQHAGRCAGPRSTRSPTKTARAAVGRRARSPPSSPTRVAEPAEQRDELVAAAVDVADDVERAVLVAPVVPQRLRARSSAASTSSARRSTWTWRKPSRCRPRSERAQLLALVADDVRAEVAVGARRGCAPGRPPRAGRGRSRPASTWCSRASATSGLRASGWTLVASMTVSRPARQPLAGDEVQHVEGVVGRGLVVLVVGDQAAAEVGRDAPRSAGSGARAKVDLPEPDAPIRTTSDSSGIGMRRSSSR